MNKKIAVVFGGSGFLGSHVADALTKMDFDVKVFDQIKSSYIKEDQEMIVGDILKINQVMKAVKGAYVVYHFAGIAGISEANNSPIEAVKYNILGTVNILEGCVKNNVSRFIFASTVYVYSEQGGIYRSCKQSSELLIENYQKLYNLDFTILRFGSLYGKRANNFNWVQKIIKQALIEGKMQRKGSGEEIRDYIHVEDAAQACISILNDNYINDYVILTGSQTIKIKELLIMIREMLDNKVSIEYLDETMEGHYEITPYTFRPRVAKKYNPKTQLDLGQGILNTIYDIYKEINDSNDEKPAVTLPE